MSIYLNVLMSFIVLTCCLLIWLYANKWTDTVSARTILEENSEERVLRWYAPFLADSGFGSEATQFIEALELAKPSIPTVIQAVQFAEPATFQSSSAALSRALQRRHKRLACIVAICHSTPNFWVPSEFPSWDYVAPCPPSDAKVRIGRAMYETDSLPISWVPRLNRMDEVWIPTHFAHSVFERAGVNKSKLRIVPEPVDVRFYDPIRCQPNHHAFTFLAVFKWEERKGWKDLFQGFLDEFKADEPVRLLIKTSGFHLPKGTMPKSIAETQFPELKSRSHQVHFREQRVSDESLLQDFYCQADAVLCPSYGEGWGRVPAEAAAMRLPVIFTNYSGPTEFLDDNNAIPIPVEKMVPATEKGHMWALPSLKSLRHWMRKVYDRPDEFKEIGTNARQTMIERYSNEVVGQLVWNALNNMCVPSQHSGSEEL